MPELTFLGHASFLLEEKDRETLLFDPYIKDNPVSSVNVDEIKADYILVSHAHHDHLGDTHEIAHNNQSLIISTAEIARQAQEKGLNAHAQHLGGRHTYPFGSVKLTLAFHGSGIPGGHACGFVVDYYGNKIFFAGDTALFSDMKLIGELDPLDLALIPIGDNYTMGIDDAVIAATYLKAREVIPYHYNTHELLKADPQKFKHETEQKSESKVIILDPGGVHVF